MIRKTHVHTFARKKCCSCCKKLLAFFLSPLKKLLLHGRNSHKHPSRKTKPNSNCCVIPLASQASLMFLPKAFWLVTLDLFLHSESRLDSHGTGTKRRDHLWRTASCQAGLEERVWTCYVLTCNMTNRGDAEELTVVVFFVVFSFLLLSLAGRNKSLGQMRLQRGPWLNNLGPWGASTPLSLHAWIESQTHWVPWLRAELRSLTDPEHCRHALLSSSSRKFLLCFTLGQCSILRHSFITVLLHHCRVIGEAFSDPEFN